jgi:hypothetical protein
MTKDEAMDLALEALESQVANVYDTESNAFKKCAPAITALKKVRSAQPAPVQEPVAWGWAILHSDGTHAFIRPRIADFFGSIQEREPFTSEYAKHADREWAGLAPHTIVTLYTTPPADMKTLQAVSDEYNAWIKHHAAGHSYDDFLQAKLKEKNT